MSDVTAIIEQLAQEAREELDAHHEWLVENPEEPDPGCDHLFIHPDDALAIKAELTRLREQVATLTRERDEARGLWEWLASRRNLELSYGVIDDPSEAFWLVHSVNGGINDREWTLVGTGSTPLEALSLAQGALTND